MKFIVSSSTLLKQLQTISGAIASNNSLPILDNFLFRLSNSQLAITASDLDTTMTTSLEVQSNEEGSAAIPARLLLDILKAFPEQPLTFILDDAAHKVEISSDYGKYSLSFEDADEYPRSVEIDDPNKAVLKADILETAISKTIFATGNDDLRPVMSGVFFQFSSSELRFVATDAHKLVRYMRSDATSSQTAEFIVPKKPLNLLKAILPSASGDITIEYNSNNARFRFDNVDLICRLIDGKYPNYEAVIPKDNPYRLTVNRSAFLNSVKRVSIFSSKTTHQIRLNIAGNEVHITAEDLDFSNRAEERLDCQYEGQDMAIGFNSRFLLEMLTNLESENVSLELSDPRRAGLLKPLDGTEEGEDVLMLVMPVMLNN